MLGLDPLSQYTTDWASSGDWANSAQSLGGASWAGFAEAPRYGPAYSYYDNQYFSGVHKSGYDPEHAFTSSDIAQAFQRHFAPGGMYAHLNDWSTPVNTGGTGTAGDVARDPNFGAFAKTPGSWDKIQAAAAKAGVPANVLQAFVAMESSGDWERDGNRLWMGRPQSGGLLPYIGVFDNTLQSRLGISASSLLGNQQGQLDAAALILAQMYGEAKQANPSYGWGNVASYYFSGYFDPQSNPWQDESGNYGGNLGYMKKFNEYVGMLDNWTRQNGGQVGTSGAGVSGMGSVNTTQWQAVNRWDSTVAEAAQKYNVPPNLIKAVMRLESGGSPNVTSPAGATGLMQVMPGMHGLSAQQLMDPRTNILKGTEILANNYRQWGSWEAATKAYLGGTPNTTAVDAHGTGVDLYWSKVSGYMNELDATVSGMFGGPEGQMGPVTTLNAIWGGRADGGIGQVTQEFGPTEFSLGPGRWMYEYSTSLIGTYGHPGVDYAMPSGTELFSPVSGTVIISGGSGFFRDENGGQGELRIRADNGHEIILGHMYAINVPVGTRVNAGQSVGTSGSFNGPHLHLEYRIPSNRFGGAWEAIDPRKALAGTFTGTLSGNSGAPGGANYVPMTFHDVLRRAASGQSIDAYGKNFSRGGSWHDWLAGTVMAQRSGASAFGNPNASSQPMIQPIARSSGRAASDVIRGMYGNRI